MALAAIAARAAGSRPALGGRPIHRHPGHLILGDPMVV